METIGAQAKRRKAISKWVTRIILLLFSVVVLVPIIWTIYTSFKSTLQYTQNAWALPTEIHWENYENAFNKGNMGAYFGNSIFVTLLSLVFMVLLAIPAAYVTSRFKFKMAKPISLLFMAGLFISQSYIVVPIFLSLSDAGTALGIELTNNLVVISLVYAVTTLPFTIYLLSGFMKSIPHDYEEAASIDGCGYFGTLFRVMLPIIKPAMITVVMFDFMSYWNEYPLALTILQKNPTLPVGLQNLMETQKFATDWGALFAGMVIVMVPTMVLYALVQKKLTEGISMGGLKG